MDVMILNLENLNEYRQPQAGDRIYRELLKSIMNGDISGGEFLPINTLSEKLNVSNTPVREALGKLSNNGILKKIPYKGYKVREFNEKSIIDIYETRAAIESYACKLTAKKATNEFISKLEKLQIEGEEFLEKDDLNNYREYNEKLHKIIIDNSRNSQLISMYKRIDRITHILAAQTIKITGRPQRAVKEHKKIIDHIKNKNSEKARKIMENHILKALEEYKDS